MSDNLYVFAHIQPKSEYFKKAKNAILEIIPATLKENGCHNFTLHENIDTKSLYLYEEWTNQQALDTHYNMVYTKNVFNAYEAWLLKPVKILKFSKVS